MQNCRCSPAGHAALAAFSQPLAEGGQCPSAARNPCMTTTQEIARRNDHREGAIAKTIENQTAQLPSDTFLLLAVGSIAASLTLKILARDKDALFVGQWVPTFLVLGIYNKLVKQLGSDRSEIGG